MAFGMPSREGSVVGSDEMFTLTPKEKALSSQAQWYVYSTMHISQERVRVRRTSRGCWLGGRTQSKTFVLTQET